MFRELLEMIPLIIPILIFMIPIVAILTQHQRKMAELVHERSPERSVQVEMLAREVSELKQLVHQQSLSLDSLVTELKSPSRHGDSQRLSAGAK